MTFHDWYMGWLAIQLYRHGVRLVKGADGTKMWRVPDGLPDWLRAAFQEHGDESVPSLVLWDDSHPAHPAADWLRAALQEHRAEQSDDRLAVEWLIASTRERP